MPDLRYRFSNFELCQQKFARNEKLKQESFRAHFKQDNHCGEKDWIITLRDKTEANIRLYRKESV